MTNSQRSGHEQELDDTFSPVGWRDKEWRNYLDCYLDASILAGLGVLLAASQVVWASQMPKGFWEAWPQSGVVLALMGVALLMTRTALVFWDSARHYKHHRKFPR